MTTHEKTNGRPVSSRGPRIHHAALLVSLSGIGCSSGDSVSVSDWLATDGLAAEWRVATTILLGEFGDAPGDPPLHVVPHSEYRDGVAWLLEPSEGQLHGYTPAGQRVRSLGGRGAGPGEFLRPVRFGFRADSLWVLDLGRGRIVWFRPDAGFLGEDVTSGPVSWQGSAYGSVGEPMADGFMLLRPTVSSQGFPDGIHPPVALLRHHPGDGRTEPMAWMASVPSNAARIPDPRGAGAGTAIMAEPFNVIPIVRSGMGGAGIIVIERHEPVGGDPLNPAAEGGRLTRIGPSGDTLWVLPLGLPTLPLTPETVDSVVDARYPWRAEWSMGLPAGAWREYLVRHFRIPELAPPARHVAVADDGRTWIGGPSHTGPHRPWIVVSSDGEMEASFSLPSDWSLQGARHDTIWGLRTGQAGEPVWFLRRVQGIFGAGS